MKNFTFINNDEASDIRTNSYSNNDIDYKNTLSYNDNDINDISTKRIFDKNDKENFNYNSTNNIESEIENDLRKIPKKLKKKKINKMELIANYLIELKKYGYPEMGKIFLSPDLQEQEKTLYFFEFLLEKEFQLKNTNNDLQIKSLKKQLNTELRKNMELKEEIDNKVKHTNEYIKENKNLKSLLNKMASEKNNLSEALTKFESLKTIIINAFETMDYVQTNDMSKMLSRVKGAEKLIETLKHGYNESLEELTKEIKILKNFIIELNNEFCYILNKPCNIDENIYNFSFTNSFSLIKEAFKGNMNLLKKIIYYNNITNSQSDKSYEEDVNIYFDKLKNKDNYINFGENNNTDNNTYETNNKFVSEDIK